MFYTIKHKYRWRQLIKIIKRHLYTKKHLQEYLEYACKEYGEDIYKAAQDTLIYGVGRARVM